MRAIALLATLAVAHTAEAGSWPGAIALPPMELDVGVGAPFGEATTTTEVLAGVHWASLAWKPTRFDLGAGYAGSYRVLTTSQLARMDVAPAGDDRLELHGVYIDAAYTLERHP